MAATPEFDLSAAEARRLAVAAQGFGRQRPAVRVDARQLRRAVDDVGLLQLDSVNVFCRSHYMPVFSRLGPYRQPALDRLAWHQNGDGKAPSAKKRELIEYWGHEASLLPVELQPLLRWRMARADTLAWKGVARVAAEKPELLEFVLAEVRERGPLRASDLKPNGRRRKPGEMWSWSEEKTALEYLFFAGRVCAARRVNFERLYDLPERVLPRRVLEAPTPSQEEAQRQLILIAARRLGVATEADLGDYFRLPRAESKARVAELAEDGGLSAVRVEGWRRPGYVAAERPRRRRTATPRALLTPFDSLVWARERTERLFGFRYRIEIYVPAPKRVYGYYVLPFLLGDRLLARVDLKSDRQAGALRVRGAFAEPGVDTAHVAEELAAELRLLGEWLGLDSVSVARKGDLAGALRRALA